MPSSSAVRAASNATNYGRPPPRAPKAGAPKAGAIPDLVSSDGEGDSELAGLVSGRSKPKGKAGAAAGEGPPPLWKNKKLIGKIVASALIVFVGALIGRGLFHKDRGGKEASIAPAGGRGSWAPSELQGEDVPFQTLLDRNPQFAESLEEDAGALEAYREAWAKDPAGVLVQLSGQGWDIKVSKAAPKPKRPASAPVSVAGMSMRERAKAAAAAAAGGGDDDDDKEEAAAPPPATKAPMPSAKPKPKPRPTTPPPKASEEEADEEEAPAATTKAPKAKKAKEEAVSTTTKKAKGSGAKAKAAKEEAPAPVEPKKKKSPKAAAAAAEDAEEAAPKKKKKASKPTPAAEEEPEE